MNHKSGKRYAQFVLIGLASGIFLLVLILVPATARQREQNARALSSEEYLTPAHGISSETRMTGVRVEVSFDGTEEVSVSPDSYTWYAVSDGKAELSLLPWAYTFTATAANRRVSTEVTVIEGEEKRVILDLNQAPHFPEYLEVELPLDGIQEVPLPVANAETVLVSELDGISLEHRNDDYYLLVDTAIAVGYQPLYLELENQVGKAVGFVGLRLPRQTEAVAVYTVDDLDKIRDNPGGSFYLANDLDMSEVELWQPIGTLEAPFYGVLDGRGHGILNLHMVISPEQPSVSFLGIVKGAEICNLVFIEPQVSGASVQDRWANGAVIAAQVENSLIEHCGVFGGQVIPEASSSGLFSAVSNSHILSCFNSADAVSSQSLLPGTGGICDGPARSYLTRCANEGMMQGTHLTGGISAMPSQGIIANCINSGQVRGIHLSGTYLPGGITQSAADAPRYHCYYVRGQSPVGLDGVGPASGIAGITWQELRTPESLEMLGEFTGPQAKWGYATLNAVGPVPLGIFPETLPPPLLDRQGGRVVLNEEEGVRFFYTLDGSDPRIYGEEAEALDLKLKSGEQLAVFAAADRHYDSEIVYLN